MDQDKWIYMSAKIKQIYEKRIADHSIKRNVEYWHYTSMEAIVKIFKDYIESSNNEIDSFNLFASHIRFMNDSEEYKDGEVIFNELTKIPELSKHVDKLSNSETNAYVLSFCENGDLLSQWKWYGRNSGVSFCFNANSAVYKTYSDIVKPGEDEPPFYDGFIKPLPVCYTDTDKNQYFNFLVNAIMRKQDGSNALDDTYLDLLEYLFIPYCKNESFVEEAEHRLVFFDFNNATDEKIKFDYTYNTGSNGITKPALNVTVRHKEVIDKMCYTKKKKATPQRPLISKMIVGPGYNQNLVFNCLIHIFDGECYSFQPNIKDPNSNDLSTGISIKGPSKIYDEKSIPSDKRVHLFEYKKKQSGKITKVKTEAYKCSNGLLIIKSAIPFRS